MLTSHLHTLLATLEILIFISSSKKHTQTSEIFIAKLRDLALSIIKKKKLKHLPEEIILDILIRLPIESVLVCKSVCNRWRELIIHPSFSNMQLSRLSDSGKLTFVSLTSYKRHTKEPQQFYYLECNDNDHVKRPSHSIRKIKMNVFENCSIVGSQNGLICLSVCHDSDDCDDPAYICNPITKEYVMLPKLNRVRQTYAYYVYTGFGYLPETNEYKVVRITQLKRTPIFESVEVYTLCNGNGWKILGDFGFNSSCVYHFINTHGVFVSETLYWVTRYGRIVAFHLADEKFYEIPTLPCLSLACDSSFHFVIRVLGGDLCCSIENARARRTDLWLLRRNRNQNMLEQEECLSMTLDKESFYTNPLALTKSGKVLLSSHACVYSFDIKSSCVKRLLKFPQYVHQTIPHMNTLVSLKALGEVDIKTIEQGDESAISRKKKRIGVSRQSRYGEEGPHCLCTMQ